MVGRPSCIGWLGTLESQSAKIQLLNEGIYGSNWVVLSDPVIKALWEEDRLISTLTFDESLHAVLPQA